MRSVHGGTTAQQPSRCRRIFSSHRLLAGGLRCARFTAMDGGGSILAMFCRGQNSKLKNVHGCTFLSSSPAKCVNLGQTSQAQAKIVVPVVRTVVVPSAYSAEARAEAPAAAASNTASTRRTTLRIGNCVSLYIAVPIKTPFPDIPAHIV